MFKNLIGKLLSVNKPTSQANFEELVLKAFNLIDRNTMTKILKANLKYIKQYLTAN